MKKVLELIVAFVLSLTSFILPISTPVFAHPGDSHDATISFDVDSLPYVTDPEHGLMNTFFDDVQIHDGTFTYLENDSHEHKLGFELAFEYGSLSRRWTLTSVEVNGAAVEFERDTTVEGDRYNTTVEESDSYVVSLNMVSTGGGGSTIIWGNPGVEDLEDEDALLTHGSAKAIAVYNPDGELVPENDWNINQADGGVDNDYGHIVVMPESRVVFEFTPEYGYQLTSVSANGVPLQAQEDINRYTFTMPDTNIHFAATFTKTEDIVSATSEEIDSGTITLDSGEFDSGTAQLSVSDVELTSDKIKDFETAATGYNIAHYLDIDLFNVFYKGKNDSDDVWSNQVHHLNNEATITLQLAEGVDASSIVIVHNIDDGDEFEIIQIDSYDPVTNTVTFRTKSFSNFAIATKVSAPNTGLSPRGTDLASAVPSFSTAAFVASIFIAGAWIVVTKAKDNN